ncbi:uncharacterized protein G2W53_017992 [Senna tora]|uniref:Uncharacterized protein n=1 Tax=Senna tora TaxID=362788 RepID=A0A834TQI1_9FABA|nr:uncharacterized protein G2W53_017992 [Senna tora]
MDPPQLEEHIKARSFATAGCNSQSLLTTVKQLKTPR